MKIYVSIRLTCRSACLRPFAVAVAELLRSTALMGCLALLLSIGCQELDVEFNWQDAVDNDQATETRDEVWLEVDVDWVESDADEMVDSDSSADGDSMDGERADFADPTDECWPLYDETHCRDGHVYWFDACGNPYVMASECAQDQTCREVENLSVCCTLEVEKQCDDNGDVVWVDSCHIPGELAEDCPDVNGQCVVDGSSAQCRCHNLWQGDDCSSCPPTVDLQSDCSLCKPGYHGTSCELCRVFVNPNASQYGHDGLSWETGLRDIDSGIALAITLRVAADLDRCDVWVIEGTYAVYRNSVLDRIDVEEGIYLVGGFSGNETDPAQRDPSGNGSLLLGCNEAGSSCVSTVVSIVLSGGIDGFTIRGGQEGMSTSLGPISVSNSTFVDVDAGIAHTGPNALTVSGCTFRGTEIGVSIGGPADSLFENCLFADNHYGISNGGSSTLQIVNSTIAGSELGVNAQSHTTLLIRNAILFFNGEDIHGPQNVNMDISYSSLSVSMSGLGNIVGDPSFVDPEADDYRLRVDSPCIDAGNSTFAPQTDMAGNTRVDHPCRTNTGVGAPFADMGAFEAQIVPEELVACCEQPIIFDLSGHEYTYCPIRLSWGDAQRACDAAGLHLVTFSSLAENDLVWELFAQPSGEILWLGATDEVVERTWAWISGESWDWEHWDQYEPNGSSNENCVEMKVSNGFWNDNSCDQRSRQFVCESR